MPDGDLRAWPNARSMITGQLFTTDYISMLGNIVGLQFTSASAALPIAGCDGSFYSRVPAQ